MRNSEKLASGFAYEYYKNDTHSVQVHQGLTKREHFAGLAMQGFAVSDDPYGTLSDMAKCAVDWSDALLEALGDDNETSS